MPSNDAAWFTTPGAPLEVRPAPYTPPRANEIVVRNRAVAINPIDWILPIASSIAFPWIKLPFVLGSDLAGDVVDVGNGVTRFKIGDRVLGHAVGSDKSRNRSAEGSFQTYTVLLETMASPIPDEMSYERASVVPLGLSTAACGLFEKNQLALDYPCASPQPKDRTLLVWGGSTSVGSNAIQLGVAAGYDVIATASPKNFAYVERLGASRAFDYRGTDVVAELIAALKGKTLAGAISIGKGSAEPCMDVVRACAGNRFVSMATYPVTFDELSGPPGLGARLAIVATFLRFAVATWFACRLGKMRTGFIFGSSLIANELGAKIYVDFLPAALASGRFVPAPEPQVVGSGLTAIQRGLEAHKAGVSAKKIVIEMPPHRA